MITTENSFIPSAKFIYAKIELIIIKLIARSPLNPSIKFAPLITNKKHNRTNKQLNFRENRYGKSQHKLHRRNGC